MAKALVLLYQTDEHHSTDSKRLIGIFTSKDYAVKRTKRKFKLKEEHVQELRDMNQTQGREVNYMLEFFERNQFYL